MRKTGSIVGSANARRNRGKTEPGMIGHEAEALGATKVPGMMQHYISLSSNCQQPDNLEVLRMHNCNVMLDASYSRSVQELHEYSCTIARSK